MKISILAEQCSLLSEQQQYTESLAACEQAISLEPRRDNIDLWTARGNALLHLGRYADSIASYRRVVEVSPNNSSRSRLNVQLCFSLVVTRIRSIFVNERSASMVTGGTSLQHLPGTIEDSHFVNWDG
ncbi:MAG: tetratricopeptide repeat protein [Leptolyngbyaceae cyanobacterium SM1_3_5]|nr:tetratricopeptide repeat protein [Leptolyngbyaceae cyanobacterium SM1_3_5]